MVAVVALKALDERKHTRCRRGMPASVSASGAAAMLLMTAATATAQGRRSGTWLWHARCGASARQFSTRPAARTAARRRVLKSFASSGSARASATTGLYEVWFDMTTRWNTWRARRSDIMIGNTGELACRTSDHHSMLIDDAGLVQGYRVVKIRGRVADAACRLRARDLFKGVAGLASIAPTCRGEGERPMDDWYAKEVCEKTADGRTMVESRRYYKAGQYRRSERQPPDETYSRARRG